MIDKTNLAISVSRNWWWASTISSRLSALWICLCRVAHPHSITWERSLNFFRYFLSDSPQKWYSRRAGGQNVSSHWRPDWRSAAPTKHIILEIGLANGDANKIFRNIIRLKLGQNNHRTQLLELACHLVQACQLLPNPWKTFNVSNVSRYLKEKYYLLQMTTRTW